VGTQNSHARGLLIHISQNLRIDQSNNLLLPQTGITASSEPYAFGHQLSEMTIEVFIDPLQFTVFLLRKGSGNIDHHHICPISQKFLHDPRQNISHEIMKLQGKLSKENHETTDYLYSQIHNYQPYTHTAGSHHRPIARQRHLTEKQIYRFSSLFPIFYL